MDAQITELLEGHDSLVLVRDQIAAILVIESASQQAIALRLGKDPSPWHFRVFVERKNPWESFVGGPDNAGIDATPIVNVHWESTQFDRKFGNVVEMQRGSGNFFIDCLAYGQSEEVEGEGHLPGDELAKRRVQWVLGRVRQILMAAAYTYLGLQPTVSRRWTEGQTALPTTSDESTVQHIAAARLTLTVDYSEFSPQVQGRPLQSVLTKLIRSDNGELLLRAEYPNDAPPNEEP